MLILAIIVLIPLLIICAIKSYKEGLEQEATDIIDKAEALTKGDVKRNIPPQDQKGGKIENMAIISVSEVERRYIGVIRSILSDREVFKVDLNKVDEHGMTVLMYAASSGHVEAIKILLAHRNPEVNPNIRSNDGMTALTLAVKYGKTEVATEFLKANLLMDINKKDLFKMAVKNNHFDTAKLFLKDAQKELKENKNKLFRYRIGLGLILLSTIIAAVFFPPCLIIIPVAIGIHIYQEVSIKNEENVLRKVETTGSQKKEHSGYSDSIADDKRTTQTTSKIIDTLSAKTGHVIEKIVGTKEENVVKTKSGQQQAEPSSSEITQPVFFKKS